MDPAQLAEIHEKMRIKDTDDERAILSKKLSYVLRHGAKDLGFEIDEGGYVQASDLLACEELFKGVALEILLDVIKQSNRDKQRYELLEADGSWLIRATGKHTMQGLAREGEKHVREKRGRKGSGSKGGGGSGGKGRQLSEEEFCTRWRLDRLAKSRLAELPVPSRQLAMQRFSPGPEVPPSDYPKVFVAFCKRFRGKGAEFDDYQDGFYEKDGSSSPDQRRDKKKKKASKDNDSGGDEKPFPPFLDVDSSGQYPAYPSPGSSPRGTGCPSSPANHTPSHAMHGAASQALGLVSPNQHKLIPAAPQGPPRLMVGQGGIGPAPGNFTIPQSPTHPPGTHSAVRSPPPPPACPAPGYAPQGNMMMQGGMVPPSPYSVHPMQNNMRGPPPPPLHAAPQDVSWQQQMMQQQMCNSPMSPSHHQNCGSPMGTWDPRFGSPVQAPMSPGNAPMSPLGGYQGGMSPMGAGFPHPNYQGIPSMDYQHWNAPT